MRPHAKPVGQRSWTLPLARSERAVFVGLARDSAQFLPSVLANLERMAAIFSDSAFLFIENNSRDMTRQSLEDWCRRRPNATLLTPGTLEASSPHRTIRLAALRNQLIDEVRKRFSDFDLLVVADCDDVNATPVTDMSPFVRAIAFLQSDRDCAAVFGNTLGVYYDMWALRHPQRCPDDVWEAIMDHALASGDGDEDAARKIYAPRVFMLPPRMPPMEVDSAFGGLGIYKLPHVLANKALYQGFKVRPIRVPQGGVREMGWQCCEHVAFHAGLRASGGRLFVLPWLVIGIISEEVIPPSAWRQMIFELEDPSAGSPTLVSQPMSDQGRNDPCSCGSGRRFKHCHGALT